MNVNSKETAAMTQHWHGAQAYVGASKHRSRGPCWPPPHCSFSVEECRLKLQ